MLNTEATIREVDQLLQRFEKSLLELKLPASNVVDRFAPKVSLTPLGSVDATSWSANSDGQLGQTQLVRWPIGPAQVTPRGRLKIWTKFLEQISYLTLSDYKVIEGQFDEEDNSRFQAVVKYQGRGSHDDGLVDVQVKLELGFRRDDTGDRWVIDRWHTKSFTTRTSPELLFQEVLERRVHASLVSPLRRSYHEEASAAILKAKLQNPDVTSKRPFPTFDFSSWTRHPGISVVDYDNDGFDDLFVVRRMGNNTMLHNRGDGTFEDSTAQAGLTTDFEEAGFTNTAIFADFDNDGDQDAFIGRSLYKSCYYENQDGVFTRNDHVVSVDLPAHVVSISAVDYNQDGLLDVYFSRYMPGKNGFNFDMTQLKSRDAVGKLFQDNLATLPRSEAREFARRTWSAQQDFFRDAPGLPNLLLKNVGNGKFVPAPEGKALQGWRPTYQATWADFDNDGDADVYLANDFSPNHLFRNDGRKFTDITLDSKTADNGFGMGATWGDFDSDGLLDLYVTNMYSKAGRRITKFLGDDALEFAPMARGNSLFQQRDGRFHRVSGTTSETMPVELAGWGWGSQFVDVDNDGHLDIFAPCGYYTAPPQVRRPVDT